MKKAILLAAALAAAFADVGRAQDAAAVPTATPTAVPTDAGSLATRRYRIESIAVAGTERASVQRIVTAEARLAPGREYGEADIRHAVNRVKRLSFVLDARPRLQRGTSPGLYELVIEIEERSDVVGYGSVSVSDGVFNTVTSTGGGVTIDRVVGAASELWGSVGVNRSWWEDFSTRGVDPTLGVGWRQYDILGPGTRLDVSLRSYFGPRRRFDEPSISLWVPVGGNHTLDFGVWAQRHQGGYRYVGTIEEPFLPLIYSDDFVRLDGNVAAGWRYDTTDDPFAPLQGSSHSFRIGYMRRFRDDANGPGGSFNSFANGGWSLSRAFRLSQHVAVQPHVGASCDTIDETSCRDNGLGVSLRYVKVGRRNRSRLFVESRVELAGWSASRSNTWTAAASAGLRLPFGVFHVRYTRSFGGTRFR